MSQPSHDSILDVPGLRVGHDTDARGVTGCTVVLPDEPAVAAVDVRGGAPGTRETDLLRPENTVDRVHAILLTGGSAYGLAAATGVMRYLERRGVGFSVGQAVVPIVPAAVLFDLSLGDPTARPDAEAGERACIAAMADDLALGSVGAGTGATVGKLYGLAGAMKGGIGSASVALPDSTRIGALVAVNALGDVVDPDSNLVLAGARPPGATPAASLARYFALERELARRRGTGTTGGNTTIGVVATDATLGPAQALRLAQAAHDGLALAVRPCHTPYDGDTFFALATGRRPESAPPLGALSAATTWVVARAIRAAILAARGLGGVPSASDLAAPDAPGRSP
ncbi:MAG: P1 family peptidase [Chloroflexota bacterium]|nr:P1 family peptidase [Chloroflexota bacterium]